MKQKKLMRVTAAFFLFILCFTILSRAADQAGVIQVAVSRPENRMITHEIRVTGKVVQNQELAVVTEAGQRVKAVWVREGERVQKGNLLFEVDTVLLQEQILEQRQEMEKQALLVKDAKSQKEVGSQQKASQLAQAQEQYSLSTQSAGVRLTRAKQAVEKAKKELEAFRKSSGSQPSDSQVEDSLTKAYEEKSEAYIEAEQELSQLKWTIEHEVYLAQESARLGGTLTKNGTVRTQSPDGEAVLELTSAEVLEETLPSASDGDSKENAASEPVQDSILSVTMEEPEEQTPEIVSSEAAQDSAPIVTIEEMEETIPETVASDPLPDFDSYAMMEEPEEPIPETDPPEPIQDSEPVVTVEEPEEPIPETAPPEPVQDSELPVAIEEPEEPIPETEPSGQNQDASSDLVIEIVQEEEQDSSALSGDDKKETDADQAGEALILPEETESGEKQEEQGTVQNTEGSGMGQDTEPTEVTEPTETTEPDTTDQPTDTGSVNLSEEELEQIEASVRESYSARLKESQSKVEMALEEKQKAAAALAQYQQEQLAAGNLEQASSEKQLLEALQAAREAYEDAAIAANEAAVTSGRAVQQAGIPSASDSSDRMNEITYEQMELKLKKLENLLEEEGRIYAEADGLITKINITTGEKTSDTTAILMADLARGYRFTAELTKEQEAYIGSGDLVTLTDGRKQKLEELEVTSVTADETDDSVYRLVVQIPEGTLEIGAAATLEFSRKSAAYPVCVPLSALHLDENNRTCVFVTETYETVMGTELRARKVTVSVLEQNESWAALAEGALTSEQEVIISSDRPAEDGSRVRISE